MYQYGHGCITEINNYGSTSTMIIDGRNSDIIKLTYEITIKEDNGKTIILKTNNIDGLKKDENIHLMYNKTDNYISNIIENPEDLWNKLKDNKIKFNSKPSFFGNFITYIKKLYLPTLLPTSLIVAIIILSHGEVYDFQTIASGFLFYWLFFLSILSYLLSLITYPPLYFIYSSLKIDEDYYQSFIEHYKNKISEIKGIEDIHHEYIQAQ